METNFTDAENVILRHFYDKLAPTFGITAMWPTLCLRSEKGEILLRLEAVTPRPREPACYTCGATSERLLPATVTIDHDKGRLVQRIKVKTCEDCYSPK